MIERPYQDMDRQALERMLAECEPFVQWSFNPNEVPRDETLTRLWEASPGCPAGAAFLRFYEYAGTRTAYLTGATHPRFRETVEPALFQWALKRAHESQPTVSSLGVRVQAKTPRQAYLEAVGFVQHPDRETLFMGGSLDSVLGVEPELPGGYTIRMFGREDLEPWLELWQQTQEKPLTPEERLSWLDYPSYSAELDWMVIAPNGRLAAYAVGNLFRGVDGEISKDSAWILWLGTDLEFRRRGLAGALIRKLCERFFDLGCHQVLLNVVADNQSAIRLYEGAGFEIIYQSLYYACPID